MYRIMDIYAQIDRQKRWIAEHGSTVAGYVQRYGSALDRDHYGSGGEAIYEADLSELLRLEKIAKAEGRT